MLFLLKWLKLIRTRSKPYTIGHLLTLSWLYKIFWDYLGFIVELLGTNPLPHLSQIFPVSLHLHGLIHLYNHLKIKRSPDVRLVLALPDYALPFELETNISSFVVGVILLQAGHPIAFFNKKMCPRMQAASAYVCEMFTITEAVMKWWQYLIKRALKIYIDKKSLKYLMS